MRIDVGPIAIYIDRLPEGLPKREAEQSGVRALLQAAFGRDVELTHAPDGRPGIEGCSISVSHSRSYAALAVAPPYINIGVDLEENAEKAARVIGRVLRGPNASAYTPLQAWTLLEAAFKATIPNEGLTLVDFILPAPDQNRIRIEGRPEQNLLITLSQPLEFGWISLVTSTYEPY